MVYKNENTNITRTNVAGIINNKNFFKKSKFDFRKHSRKKNKFRQTTLSNKISMFHFCKKILRTCPSMLPKSKNLTSDSILLLVLLLSISGVGKKSQRLQNCLRIRVIIFNFSGVHLEGCNHLWKCGQKISKFYSILGVENAQFNIESPLMKIKSWNLPHWWLLYWFTGYPKVVLKWASLGKIWAVKTQKILKLSPWKDIIDDKQAG